MRRKKETACRVRITYSVWERNVMMSKKISVISAVLCILALCLSATALVTVLKQNDRQEVQADLQYVMYLGTNDKDTNEPVFQPEEAKKQAEEILIAHFGGYTIQEASGGWIDGDTVYQEYTLVIYLSDTDLEQVHKAAADLIDTFHQSSVLIQANQTTTEFYAG